MATYTPLDKDILLQNGPEDSISDLAWSPVANHLAVSSWDNKVRIYDCSGTLSGEGKAMMEFGGPVLSCDWSQSGQHVVGAGADKSARLLDLASPGLPCQQVAAHSAPVRSVRFITIPNSSFPMIVTGSWDKTVSYWDLRQSQPAATITCQDRIYSMDAKNKLLVIGTADRWVNIVDLDHPTVIKKSVKSPLREQTRVVTCFADANGWAVGSIEGRCAFQYINEKDASSNFSFKCHRTAPVNNKVEVYTVNDISFHPIHNTFSTAGSDGFFHFWDKDAHSRLKGYGSVGGAISATAFNGDGSLFAYAVSYDWSKGYQGNQSGYPTKVVIHAVTSDDCTPRKVVGRK